MAEAITIFELDYEGAKLRAVVVPLGNKKWLVCVLREQEFPADTWAEWHKFTLGTRPCADILLDEIEAENKRRGMIAALDIDDDA